MEEGKSAHERYLAYREAIGHVPEIAGVSAGGLAVVATAGSENQRRTRQHHGRAPRTRWANQWGLRHG